MTPPYYLHASGLQPIHLAMHMPLPLGDALIYVARAGLKDGVPAESDIRKAMDGFRFERQRRQETGPYWRLCDLLPERLARWLKSDDSLRAETINRLVQAVINWHDEFYLQAAEDAVVRFGRSLGVKL